MCTPVFKTAEHFCVGPFVMDEEQCTQTTEKVTPGGVQCNCHHWWRKVLALVITQTLFISGCLTLTLWGYFTERHDEDIGIYLRKTREYQSKLEFEVFWQNRVDLNREQWVELPCPGPYVVHFWVCLESLDTHNTAVGNLTLEVEEGALASYPLSVSSSLCIRQVHQLNLEEKPFFVRFHNPEKNLKLRDLYLGLHNQLGAQCFPDFQHKGP